MLLSFIAIIFINFHEFCFHVSVTSIIWHSLAMHFVFRTLLAVVVLKFNLMYVILCASSTPASRIFFLNKRVSSTSLKHWFFITATHFWITYYMFPRTAFLEPLATVSCSSFYYDKNNVHVDTLSANDRQFNTPVYDTFSADIDCLSIPLITLRICFHCLVNWMADVILILVAICWYTKNNLSCCWLVNWHCDYWQVSIKCRSP